MGFLNRKKDDVQRIEMNEEENLDAKEDYEDVRGGVLDLTPKPVEEQPQIEERKPVKEKAQDRIIVVRKLPTQVVREITNEDGSKTVFMTIEEALTSAMNK